MLLKVLLAGDSNVGKNDILWRFSDDNFNSNELISTVGIDHRIKTMDLYGEKIKLQIWNTGGKGRIKLNSGFQAIMLVYDITNDKSYDSVTNRLRTLNVKDTEIMLVGNYCHLEEDRQVLKCTAQSFAAKHGLKFMEISTEKDLNINQAFHELVDGTFKKQSKPLIKITASPKTVITTTTVFQRFIELKSNLPKSYVITRQTRFALNTSLRDCLSLWKTTVVNPLHTEFQKWS